MDAEAGISEGFGAILGMGDHEPCWVHVPWEWYGWTEQWIAFNFLRVQPASNETPYRAGSIDAACLSPISLPAFLRCTWASSGSLPFGVWLSVLLRALPRPSVVEGGGVANVGNSGLAATSTAAKRYHLIILVGTST